MRVLRLAGRLVLFGVLVYAVTCAAVYVSHRLYLADDLGEPVAQRPVRVAIVLGGGIRPDGQISHASRVRVRRAIAAVGTEGNTMLVMSGGGQSPASDRPSAALMRDLTVAEGFPAGRIVLEADSRSTFENLARALPIADRLGAAADGRDLLLVTDSTHALRSRLLACFFGRTGVQVSASNAFAAYRPRGRVKTILREAAAWWYNLAKAAAWQALGLAGLSPAERLDYVH